MSTNIFYKKLVIKTIKKLDKEGQSKGVVKIGKYIIEIEESGSLGLVGTINSPHKGHIEFNWDYMTNKFEVQRFGDI